MSVEGFSSELDRALARPDASALARRIDAYAAYFAESGGEGEWSEDQAEAFAEITSCYREDPDEALAYVILGASRSDDPEFVRFLGCGPLEDLLHGPTEKMIARVVAEARKSARFRWLLSNPFKVAVSAPTWAAIEAFRITGPHEEPALETMPASYFS